METKPLSSLSEILDWSRESVDSSLIGQDLVQSSSDSKTADLPQTLVCHDMQGGYLTGDKCCDGCSLDEESDPFYLCHWWYMDIFVYFSHNLVTVPPVGWINAAHKHGVTVLGTFITEWDDGAKICREFLSNEQVRTQLVEQLVEICVKYNFEGWLINIENVVEFYNIPFLRQFVADLTNLLRERIGPKSRVIWYDSVICDSGQLKWQNELNTLNKSFFDVCDGIFLNYTWKEPNLETSSQFASDRSRDVFVGIDVFGRNCVGGFECDKPMLLIRKHALSAAIFAPGWVYETLPKTQFTTNLHKFFNLFKQHVFCRRLDKLPIDTNFNNGIIWNEKRFNLSNQGLQAHFLCDNTQENSIEHSPGGQLTITRCFGPVRLLCVDLQTPVTVELETDKEIKLVIWTCEGKEIKNEDVRCLESKTTIIDQRVCIRQTIVPDSCSRLTGVGVEFGGKGDDGVVLHRLNIFKEL